MLAAAILQLPRSSATYEALAALRNRVWPESPTCAAWLVRSDAEREPGAAFERVAVLDPGDPSRLAAVAERWRLRTTSAEPHRFFTVEVDPAHRRRGLGTALLGRVLEDLPAGTPCVMGCETTEDRPEAMAFLERRAFRPVLRTASSELDLAAFDPARLGDAARRAQAAGIVLRALGPGGARDERLLRGLHALHAAVLRDVPGAADAVCDPFEVWRRAYHENPDLLPEAHGVALDGEEVVGMTQLWASQASDAILYTGFTGVARSHRRHGLATALKVASLAWARTLRTASGRPPVVRTSNADTNPMLGINLRLGFVERPARIRYERALARTA